MGQPAQLNFLEHISGPTDPAALPIPWWHQIATLQRAEKEKFRFSHEDCICIGKYKQSD